MKLAFQAAQTVQEQRRPQPAPPPQLRQTQIAALYRGIRLGGDYYDFVVERSRLIFVLLDVAGRRERALHLAACVQESFRQHAPKLFGRDDFNQADALTALTIELNRALIAAAQGVHCGPAFLGCYDEDLGTLAYINAGHTTGLLKDRDGIALLESNGLPLGLFSHTTHDAQLYAMRPGAVLLLVSKGLVEARRGRKEFGLERVREVLAGTDSENAEQICAAVLDAVQSFAGQGAASNDTTALALARAATAAHAVATQSRR